jgi:alkanesulfonate monooxygenase SsuD/methylene tetrahydromethanopterin reductase-like flavin-dependent oxidoreductase (luciferase family)
MAAPAIGVFLPTMTERGEPMPDVVAAARRAEDLGFESVWVVDQLIAGTGAPFVDSTVALSAVAGVTSRIRLAFGVMILPLRPVVWAAKQIASLQHMSGNRLLLGVGVGGDRHSLSWEAAGVPRRERGRRTDAALAVLPGLIAGEAVNIDGTNVQIAPGATVPPIIVGGMAEAALTRAARADGWFTLPLPPAQLVPAAGRLAGLAARLGRAVPPITSSMSVAIDGDPALPDHDGLIRRLTDPDGMFGMPAAAVPDILVTGGPSAVADRISALGAIGVQRVVVTLAAGDWFRQLDLLAQATDLFCHSRSSGRFWLAPVRGVETTTGIDTPNSPQHAASTARPWATVRGVETTTAIDTRNSPQLAASPPPARRQTAASPPPRPAAPAQWAPYPPDRPGSRFDRLVERRDVR